LNRSAPRCAADAVARRIALSRAAGRGERLKGGSGGSGAIPLRPPAEARG